MEERLREVVAEVLDIEPDSVTAETRPETVETWDSLTHLRLVTAIEGEFGVQLSMEAIQSVECVGDFATHVQKATGS